MMIDFSSHLEAGEQLLWEGRPAPRCYTFSRWRHSLFGLVFLAFGLRWLYWGGELMDRYETLLLPLVPIPFVLLGLYLSIGQLIVARIRWESIHYAMTDRRLLHQERGKLRSIELGQVQSLRLTPLGQELGTLCLWGRSPKPLLTCCCIEYPRQLVDLLEPIILSRAPDEDTVPESV